jgi:hypothetical protein
MRVAPLELAPGDPRYPAGRQPLLEFHDRPLFDVPMVEDFAIARSNAYLVALYGLDRDQPEVAARSAAGDVLLTHPRLELAGWMLHLPWAKNPAPMNRSGSRGGWREAALQSRTVREVAFQLALHRIPRQARIRVRLDWHVTTRRVRDEDNLVRCMKHLVDGLRLAGVVDDDDRRYVLRDMPEIQHRPEADGGYAHMRLYVAKAS